MDISIVRKFREYIRHIERELNIQNNATCCEGVTLAQCHTLLEVYAHKSISLNELSDKLYLDKSTVSRTVDSLVKNGTANRVIPEENRRKVTISLTGKGNGICRQINRDSDAYFDAIITIAVSPEGFDRVIRLADRNDVVIVPFDNVLDTKKVMQVNEDQLQMGRMYADWLIEQLGDKKDGKILEVRGLQGNSVDRDRHTGFLEVLEPAGNWDVVEVVGNWDDGTAQKVTADAIAVHSEFVGVVVQGGTTGAVRALLDAEHPLVPIAGESENGFRKLLAEHGPNGLHGISIGQSPGMVAIAIKAALAALDGNVMPQLISVPIPFATYDQMEADVNYWPDLTDNFFTVNEFPPCDVNITAREIMSKDAD